VQRRRGLDREVAAVRAVPISVPSLFHSSRPMPATSAVKKSVGGSNSAPLTVVWSAGFVLAETPLMSLT
jgi:hypothetical protein